VMLPMGFGLSDSSPGGASGTEAGEGEVTLKGIVVAAVACGVVVVAALHAAVAASST
jgi:hypothetical protein